MKKVIFFAGVFLLSIVFCSGVWADPAEGFWISVDENTGRATAGWEIYTRGNLLYGRILSVAGHPQDVKALNCRDSYRDFPLSGKVSEMTVVGTPWIFGLTLDRQNRPGVWSGGQIIDPNTGSMYRCRVTYHAQDGNRYKTDTLEMRGEIGLGIGRSQFWQKCSREEASALR